MSSKHCALPLVLGMVIALGCASAAIDVPNRNAIQAVNNTLLLNVIPDKREFGSASAEFLDDETALEEYNVIAREKFRKIVKNIRFQDVLKTIGVKRSDIITFSASEGKVNIDTEKVKEVLARTGAASITVMIVAAQDSAYHGDRFRIDVGTFNGDGWITTYADTCLVPQYASFKGKFNSMLDEYLNKLKQQL